jgi:hypothetical protein
MSRELLERVHERTGGPRLKPPRSALGLGTMVKAMMVMKKLHPYSDTEPPVVHVGEPWAPLFDKAFNEVRPEIEISIFLGCCRSPMMMAHQVILCRIQVNCAPIAAKNTNTK